MPSWRDGTPTRPSPPVTSSGWRPARARRAALGADEASVNTIHHHLIADAGELEVTATTAEGVIEALEPRGDWPCVGVQWHPEKMHEPEQRGLFEWLVAQAANAGAPGRRGSEKVSTSDLTAATSVVARAAR